MTTASRPFDHVYVVKLVRAPGAAPHALSGRLEHVSSGRRREFPNGQALLDFLAEEEAWLAEEGTGDAR